MSGVDQDETFDQRPVGFAPLQGLAGVNLDRFIVRHLAFM